MAGNIKGITIQFKGETSQLEQAIRKVNSSTKDIDKNLREVNNALKFNPTNVDLWRQKQDLLSKKVKETETNLKELKNMQKQLDTQGVDKNSQEYQKLQREIVTTESKLKHFKAQLDNIGNANLQALSAKLKGIGDKMTSVGQTMTTKVTAPIVAGYTVAAKYASDYEENLNKIDVAFGSNAESVKEWANTARTEYGLSKVQATDAASAFGALGKGIGLTDKEAAGMATTLTGLSADLGSYFNVGVDESAKALEGIFTGESEALKKFGVVMTDTNLKQFAEDQGLVWEEMDQTQKTMLRYQFVLDKTKDAQGDFSRTNDGTANSLKIFQASVQDLATAIGTNLLPIITPIVQKITELVNKFNELPAPVQKAITIAGLVIAAVGPLLVILGTLVSSVGALIGAAPAIIGAMGTFITTVAPVIAIIGALIAIGVLLYKNWDVIKAKALQLKNYIVTTWNNIKCSVVNTVTGLKNSVIAQWNALKARVVGIVSGVRGALSSAWATIKSTASSAWNSIKEAIISPIQTAKDTISGIIDTIKGLFPLNIGRIFSNLQLPHISVSGGSPPFGIGGKGSLPHFNVDWYAKGGIFNSPSVIGVGEAGSEAVVPLDKFWSKLDKMGEGAGDTYNFYITGNDPKAIAEEVKKILINDTNRRRLAWQ